MTYILRQFLLALCGSFVIVAVGVLLVIVDVSHRDPLGLISTPWGMPLMALPIVVVGWVWNRHWLQPVARLLHARLDAWHEDSSSRFR